MADFPGKGNLLVIDKTWDGLPLQDAEVARVAFCLEGSLLEIRVSAPFYADPPPPGAGGELDGLWEYEVVELFLLVGHGHYLEVELGPHGHYLVLHLDAVRHVKGRILPCHFAAAIKGNCWQARMLLDIGLLPLPLSHANAYAIHGVGQARRYLAAFPVPGAKPDFHQPQFFRPVMN